MQFETDSTLVDQSLIADEHEGIEVNALLYECRDMLRRSWTVEVRRIYREANFVADGIANWAFVRPVGYYPLPVPPVELSLLLMADAASVTRPRLVSNNIVGMQLGFSLLISTKKNKREQFKLIGERVFSGEN